MMSLLVLAIAATAVWLVINLLQRCTKSKSAPPPGPRAIPLVGHLHLLTNPHKAPPHKVLQGLSQCYGPVMSLRFGSVPIVVASTADAAREFLKTYDAIFASRPPTAIARIFVQDSDLVWAPYGDRWRQLRRLATLELFTTRRIDVFKEARREEVKALCQSALESASSKSLLDLRASLTTLTFNLMTFMLMSKRYFGKNADDKQEGKQFMDVIFKAFEVCGEFPIGDYFPLLRFVDPVAARMKVIARTMDDFLDAGILKRVRQRNSSSGETVDLDFLDVMLDLRERGEKYLQGPGVKALMSDLLNAGTDTSAVALEWTLAEVIKHPAVMAKAQQELDRVVGLERMVEESDIPQLDYLQAVVKESLRLHPVVPLLLPHQSTQACTLMGYGIAKNTTLIVNSYAIGRDPSLWEDPLVFKPERFLGTDIDMKGQHFELLPFGAGRRICPGLTLALATVHLTLANLVHGFDWKEAQGAEIDTVSEHYGLTLTLANKLQAVPVARFPHSYSGA